MSSGNRDNIIDLAVGAIALVYPPAAALSTFAGPLSKVFSNLIERRQEEAKEIFRAQLEKVDEFERLSQDPESIVAKAARFHQAAIVGAAHKNLRVLARLMLGHKMAPGLVADEFLAMAGVIESLRHDELIVLNAFISARKLRDRPHVVSQESNLWGTVQKLMKGTFDKEELVAITSGLTRTGFVIQTPGLDGGSWTASRILMRLESCYQLSDILTQEKQAATE